MPQQQYDAPDLEAALNGGIAGVDLAGAIPPFRTYRDEIYDHAAAAREIESQGGLSWARHYFPYLFTRPDTKYQKEFWTWAWTVEANRYYRPYVECDPRGVGKSTHAEVFCTSLIARRKRQMIGYVSFEEDKAAKHFDSIRTLFENGRFLQDYPDCAPKIQTLRNAVKQWSREAIITASDAMIVPLSLQGSSRGWKSPVGRRFDVIVLDDIDKLGMSVDLIAKLIELLKGEILAAGDDNTLVLVPQNLIHRESIVTQIFDGRADILSDRDFRGPYPLLKYYDAEKVPIPGDTTGAKKWVITSGEPYDPAISLDYAEKLLNKYGKDTFDRECQQDVFKVAGDRDFREWDEVYHVITYTEFRKYFERFRVPIWNEAADHPQIPDNWNVGLGLDWGTTRGHPSAIAAIARPNENIPLHDCFFAFTEIVLPTFPYIVGDDVPLVSPGRVMAAEKQALAEWNVDGRQTKLRLMSHEASAALNTMLIDLPDELKTAFSKWKPKRGSGVPQVQNLLEIDRKQRHPFRPFLKGRPRLYFVVPDEQGRLMQGELGRWHVAQPVNYKGFARARYEIPIYSQYNSGQKKTDDDYVDALLGLMNVFGVSSQGLTKDEKADRSLPEQYRSQTLEDVKGQISGEEYSRRLLSRQVKLAVRPILVGARPDARKQGRFAKFKR